MKFLLGLDNGGTVIKAALFDLAGNQCAVASRKSELIMPRPGIVERDMDVIWNENVAVIRDVIQRSGVRGEEIGAVGISGHGKGLYLLDKEGLPLGNGIVSTDNRAVDYEIRFNQSSVKDEVRAVNFQNILACQPVCLLAWMKEHDPLRYSKIGAILAVKDFVRYKLTGEVYAERTDISGTNLFNLTEGGYSETLLKLFGIEEIYAALPKVRNSCDICGRVSERAARETGLAAGTVVSGGVFDIDACALSLGIVDERDIGVIAGTWSINEYIQKKPADSGMNSYYCIPNYYLVEECSPTSAGNLDWVLKRFFSSEIEKAGGMNDSFYDRLNEMVEGVDAFGNDVLFLPFLFSSNEGPGYRGTFLNLTADVTKAQIAAAIYEGVVFSHKTHIDRLLRNKGEYGDIRLAGGAANSAVWCQIFADVLQRQVKTGAGREAGCFGAALTAGIASAAYTDLKDMVKKSIRLNRVYDPNPRKKLLYEQKYRRYRVAIAALRSFYGHRENCE